MSQGTTRPIFLASAAEVPQLREAIADHGCFVLRQLFDPAGLRRIRERADFVRRAWDYMIDHGYTHDIEEYLAGVFRAGHLPETHIDVTTTWNDLTTGSLFDQIAAAVFGATTRSYALRRSVLRGKQHLVQFHQDAGFIGTEPWYNFWTPLQDCGGDAPGLEVVMGSGVPVVDFGKVNDPVRMETYVGRTYASQAWWAPELKAGDALVFTSMMFHRTQTGPNHTGMRYSLEIRGPIADRTLAIANVPSEWDRIDLISDVPV